MKTKSRKIWSIPIAVLALVLMLAGALVVTSIVQAQAASVKPRVANAVEDFELQINAGSPDADVTTKAINLSDSAPMGDVAPPVFTDKMSAATAGDPAVDDPLAFTVMTSNGSRALIALGGGSPVGGAAYSAIAATDGGVVSNWWDGLTSAQRQAVIGLSDDELDAPGTLDDDDCENEAWCREFDHDDDPETAEIDGVGPYSVDSISDPAKIIVTQAFHWNMLSGAEMVAAARAGELPRASSYAKTFADLVVEENDDDPDTTEINQRDTVQSLYDTTNPSGAQVLERGEGNTLTVTSGDGADTDPTDLRADNVGEATITVKASDSTGRLIPPGDGSDTVGDSFDVDVIYQRLGAIESLGLAVATDSTATIQDLDADGNVIPDSGAGAAAVVVTRRITVSDDAEGAVVTVTAEGETAGTGITRAVFEQLINYSLSDGSNLPFAIDGGNGTASTADIKVKAGATLVDSSFTITSNEEGVSSNRATMLVEVVVASGNMGPSFDDAVIDALTADVTLREHDGKGKATDLITSDLPIDFGANASDGDNQVLSYSLTPPGKGISINTGTGVVSADVATPVDFDDEDADNNAIEVTVTVSDGTLSDTYKFTLMVTTNLPKADVSRDDVKFVEADEEDEDSVDMHVVTVSVDEVRIDQRGVVLADLADYITQSADTSSLTYTMLVAMAPLRIETDSSEVIMDYVPDPGDDDILEYSLMISVDDGYATEEDEEGDDIPDLVLHVNITITVEPLPDQAFPVAEVDIDENEIGVVLPSDHAALVGLIGDEAVEVAHAGGTGAGATDSDNFSVDGATGEVTLDVAQDFEVDGGNHTVTLRVERTRDSILLGTVTVLIQINDVNEAPAFASDAASTAWVAEDAQDTHSVMTSDLQEAVAFVVTAVDEDGDTLNYSVLGSDGSAVPFAISSGGALTVSGNNALDHEVTPSYSVVITANDGVLNGTLNVAITIGNSNEAPYFVNPTLEIDVDEDVAVGDAIETYVAADPDDIVLEFTLKNQDDTEHFSLGLLTGELTIAKGLDYETQQVHLVEINVTDTSEASAEIQLTVNVTDVNDNRPAWNGPLQPRQSTPENTARGVVLGNYGATDADRDGADTVTYSLGGDRR